MASSTAVDEPAASPPAAAPAPAGAGHLTRAEIRAIVFGLMTAMLLAALDQTIVATAMPTIGLALGDAENLPWIVTAYLLASTAVTPLYGKLSDIHGRRVMLLIAVAVFIVGSVACALAPSMVALALARALQGIGGGGLIALSQTILADIMSPKERAAWQVVIAGVFVAASVAGPLLGGFCAEHLHWSLIFWINLPIGFVAFALTNGALKRLPRHERRHRLDYPGAALMVSGSVALLLALSWGGVRYPWDSAPVLALLALSAVLGLGFALRLATAPEPLIPAAVLRNRVVVRATLAACFAMGTFIGLTIYVPIFLEGVLRLTASEAGVALVPLMAGTVTGATLSGRSMIYFRHYKRVPLAMMVVSIVCCAGVAVWGRALPFWLLELMLALLSIGIGTILPLSTITIQNVVAPHQLGIATAAMNFFRSLGGALIVAAFGTIVIGGAVGGDGAGVGHSVEALIRGADPARLALAFQYVFGAACLGLLAAFTFLALLEERPLGERPALGGSAAEGA